MKTRRDVMLKIMENILCDVVTRSDNIFNLIEMFDLLHVFARNNKLLQLTLKAEFRH